MTETYRGISEIVWIAWEAIGTLSAAFLTLIALITLYGSKILNYLYSPNIKASKPEIKYVPVDEIMGTRGKIQLSWKITNHPKLLFFGKMGVNLNTRYWFDKKDREGWTYSGNVGPLPILPKKETWRQNTEYLIGELESAEYILILVFYQTGFKDKDREDAIGYSEFTIPWSPDKSRAAECFENIPEGLPPGEYIAAVENCQNQLEEIKQQIVDEGCICDLLLEEYNSAVECFENIPDGLSDSEHLAAVQSYLEQLEDIQRRARAGD